MKHYYLLALTILLPFLAGCSSTEKEEDAVEALKLLSTTPTANATDVSSDITQIELKFNHTVTLQPRGRNLSTLNGSYLFDKITVTDNLVTIPLSNVTANSTFSLYIPNAAFADSFGNTSDEINLTFTIKGVVVEINVEPAVQPDMTGMSSEAIAWTKKIYAGWNLGNTFEASAGTWNADSQSYTDIWKEDTNEWETAWGNPKTTEAMIVALKNNGFNAIRIPVLWAPHIVNESTMEIDSRWIGRIKEVVDYAVNNGMYAIINTHHDLWMENRPLDKYAEQISDKETKLWTNIATYFRDYDEHLVFAATNEVNINWAAPTTENLRVQNGFNQDFVAAVRATGGRNWYRNLIVQTYSSNPSYGLQGFIKPTDVVDNRLIVEFHWYSPYDYCSGLTSGSNAKYYWGKAYASYGETSTDDEDTLSNLFTTLDNTWHSQGLGIIMGETGVSYHLDGKNDDTQIENMGYYLKTVFSTAKSHGIAPFVWDNNVFGNKTESYGIFDRNNNMNVRTPAFLDGIMEGAKTSYPN